jgi:hypothetical protein
MPIHSMPIDALDRACSYRGVIRRYSPTCLMAIAVLRLTARVKSNLLWEPRGAQRAGERQPAFVGILRLLSSGSLPAGCRI